MDKNQAIEKINKLLRLANDKGATENEKAVALKMANKVAEKYGLKIQKKENTQVRERIIPFWVKVPSYKRFILEAMMEALGFYATFDNKNKTVKFWAKESFNQEKFLELYKFYRAAYRSNFKEAKNTIMYWDINKTKRFNEMFRSYIINTIRGRI